MSLLRKSYFIVSHPHQGWYQVCSGKEKKNLICLEVDSSISRWLSLSCLFQYLTTTTKTSDGWEASKWRMVRARRRTHTPCGEFDDQDTKMVMIMIIMMIQVRGAGHMVPISKPKVARDVFQAFISHPTWSCP